MGKPAVETPLDDTGAAPQPQRVPVGRRIKKILMTLASLKLTVVLFSLAILMVFFGTLAQIDADVWTVVGKYFRTLGFVWIPLQIFFPRDWHVPGGFPYPGGWLIGALLLINLLAAHSVRFRLTWKRSGIVLLHAGVIVMMVGELVTGLFAVEGNMSIAQNKSSNFLEDEKAPELAIIDPSDPKTDDVVAIPLALLRKNSGLIQNELLPFDVKVDRYMVNSAPLKDVPAGAANQATAGDGLLLEALEKPEGTGVSSEAMVDIASAYVTFLKKGTDQSLGTYLVSVWLTLNHRPQQVTLDGKTYQVYLRFQRIYKPYAVHLLKFTHGIYTGTDIPKDFRSQVRLEDPSRGENRETEIYMNHPLRYGGETFYQARVLGDDEGTVLQVVRNPGWLMPYLSCGMVALGMLVHFGIHLVGFLRRRLAT